MTVETVLFYVMGFLTVMTGLFVVRSKNLVHAAFWTMPCFLNVAFLFLLLGNELMFTVQLLIYAGAIPITVLFVLMLTREVMSEDRIEQGKFWPLGVAVATMFLIFAIIQLKSVPEPTSIGAVSDKLTAQVGEGFLTGYLLPFEAASLMLLGSLVGAIYLARADRRKNRPAHTSKLYKKEEIDADSSASTLADRVDAAV
jgi:NADH:ubiquinone oxidoreductase subunit 6 (subunit J)